MILWWEWNLPSCHTAHKLLCILLLLLWDREVVRWGWCRYQRQRIGAPCHLSQNWRHFSNFGRYLGKCAHSQCTSALVSEGQNQRLAFRNGSTLPVLIFAYVCVCRIDSNPLENLLWPGSEKSRYSLSRYGQQRPWLTVTVIYIYTFISSIESATSIMQYKVAIRWC
jgi:hypothetical protein